MNRHQKKSNNTMHVIKRNGANEDVNFDKIATRIRLFTDDLTGIDIGKVTQEIVMNMSDNMRTSEIDTLAASVCVSKQLENPDYEKLATRLVVSNLHKTTSPDLIETYEKLRGVIRPELFDFIKHHAVELQEIIEYGRDYEFDFFGINTVMKLYCLRVDDQIIERPSQMYLRVAAFVSGYDIERTRETYDILSRKLATFGSPTLFNAGTTMSQLASCFLMTMGDSIDGIFECFHDMAKVSKLGGGIGVFVGDVRSRGAPIRSTNGRTDGLLPMVRCVNSIAQYVNQSSRRKGAVAVYIGIDHPDITDLLDIRRPGGDETLRARDIFLALMVSDLFMERLKDNAEWSLFDPDECPGLSESYGDAYRQLYEKYEGEGRAKRIVNAKDLWNHVIRAQIESGVPYILYKDQINEKSNQKNIGTIKCSNLCAEIVQYSDENEIAVCNLGSVCLPKFVRDGEFQYDDMMRVVQVMAKNLDRVIDINTYPSDKTERSNRRHRPIGLGVQGLADVFVQLGMAFDSNEAVALSKKIAAAMYYAAIEASVDLAKEHGPYPSYNHGVGCPLSRGEFQFDLWGIKPDADFAWQILREKVLTHGVRNSLSIAIMPTASTAQICGNTESVEPITSLVYIRRTLAGEHICLYKPLVEDLVLEDLWNDEIVNDIVSSNGSIQQITSIPERLRNKYKTAWDVKQKWVLDHAAARGPYICQTQSTNVFFSKPTLSMVAKMHAYGHKKGLKTGTYYLRTKAATSAQQHTISVSRSTARNAMSDDESEVCLNCSA
jgi:ribonucleoside-diphosphate reductase alpha chain